jgi:hypothetical protein
MLISVVFVTFFVLRKAFIVPGKAPYAKCEIVKTFSFSDNNALKEWEEKVFKGNVEYKIEREGDNSYVRAISDKAASALYFKTKLDPKGRFPMIGWKWRVEKFPGKTKPESLEVENEDDFAARVYVIFPAMFITNSKVLEYVWSEKLPVGTVGTSPYSKNIKLIVLRQGKADTGKWYDENRDIVADYKKLFGKSPEHDVGAIAFMTNTEHTGTSAEAMYDDIQIGYNDGSSAKEGGGNREN